MSIITIWLYKNKGAYAAGMNGIRAHSQRLRDAQVAEVLIGISLNGKELKNKPAQCVSTEPAKEPR